MNRTVTFGIVGGYGATGRSVASELWKSCDGEILVGGRDLAKGKALAAEFDNRVSAAQLDILDAHSLDDFCSQCSIIVNCELDEVGRRLNNHDVFTYAYVSGFRTIMATTLMALVPLPEGLSVRLLRNVFRRNRLPVDGFVLAQILGRSQGCKLVLTVQLVYRERRDYWIHGLALATVARIVSESKGVRAGLNFLADAVDPIAFMTELRKAGVDQIENFEQSTL